MTAIGMIFAAVMTREELILDCRYYNGEDKAPSSIPEEKGMLWYYEQCWVRFVLENDPLVRECIEFYTKEFDLPNLLPDRIDGTPIGIKAILWNRWDHWGGTYLAPHNEQAESFKRWFLQYYVADTKTHRQLLNL